MSSIDYVRHSYFTRSSNPNCLRAHYICEVNSNNDVRLELYLHSDVSPAKRTSDIGRLSDTYSRCSKEILCKRIEGGQHRPCGRMFPQDVQKVFDQRFYSTPSYLIRQHQIRGKRSPISIPFLIFVMLAFLQSGHCHPCRSQSFRWPRSLAFDTLMKARVGVHQPDEFNGIQNMRSTSPLVCQHASEVCQ